MGEFSKLLRQVDECKAQIRILKNQPRIDPSLMFNEQHIGLNIPSIFEDCMPEARKQALRTLNNMTMPGCEWIVSRHNGLLLTLSVGKSRKLNEEDKLERRKGERRQLP